MMLVIIRCVELPSDRTSYAAAGFGPVKQPTNKKVRFDIKRLYHLAEADNLDSILKRGLMSTRRLVEEKTRNGI